MLRLRRELRVSALCLNHPHPYKFVTAQFKKPAVYGCWRMVWALVHLTWLLLSFVLDPWVERPAAQRVKWIIYLTNWTYLLLTVQTVLEAANFFVVRLLRDDILKDRAGVTMPWYLKLQWVLYNVVTTGSLMVTAWYWTFLYKSDKEMGAVRFAFHALNSVYVLLNLALTSTPTRILHAIHPVLFGVTYTLFSALYHVSGGTNVEDEPYIYRVTDWRRPWKTLLISSISNFVAIPIAHLAIFLLRLAVGRLWKAHCCSFGEKHKAITHERVVKEGATKGNCQLSTVMEGAVTETLPLVVDTDDAGRPTAKHTAFLATVQRTESRPSPEPSPSGTAYRSQSPQHHP